MKIITQFLIIILSVNIIYAKSPKWFTKVKQIKLLSSSRNNVHNILRQPEISKDSVEYFRLKDVWISIEYSLGNCENGWNIKKEVVIGVEISIGNGIRPSDLGLNLKKFRFYKESDTTNTIYYSDTLGEEYALDRKLVHSISYTPPEKFDSFLCVK